MIPDDVLWPPDTLAAETKQKHAPKDLTQVAAFLQSLRNEGVTAPKALARLVDITFPGLLTNQELGELLPARAQRNIKFESERKRGQRLRRDK